MQQQHTSLPGECINIWEVDGHILEIASQTNTLLMKQFYILLVEWTH